MLCLQKGKKSYTKNNPVYVTTILHCVKLWSILHIFERSTFIFFSFLSMNVLTIKFVVFFVAVERPKFWGRCKRFRKYNPLTTPSSHQHHPCNHPCTACQSKSKSRPSWRYALELHYAVAWSLPAKKVSHLFNTLLRAVVWC